MLSPSFWLPSLKGRDVEQFSGGPPQTRTICQQIDANVQEEMSFDPSNTVLLNIKYVTFH